VQFEVASNDERNDVSEERKGMPEDKVRGMTDNIPSGQFGTLSWEVSR